MHILDQLVISVSQILIRKGSRLLALYFLFGEIRSRLCPNATYTIFCFRYVIMGVAGYVTAPCFLEVYRKIMVARKGNEEKKLITEMEKL